MANKFKIKYKMEESQNKLDPAKEREKRRNLGRTVMLHLPRTIREAEMIVNTYLENNLFVLFTDCMCPFSHHTMEFLNVLGIEYENIALDGFGNKQLIQNYLQRLCGNKVQARCPPVAFLKNAQEDAKRIFLIGADGIAQAWQTQTLHEFYPHVLSPYHQHEKYQNGEWDINEWRTLTQIQTHMSASFGYKSPTHSSHLKPFEPHPQTIKKWSQYVSLPILAKDIA
eukprot:CAMPEP_0202702794 /NCGR_PEP_ID=MMETSP1385-20130828/15725_1 /ASSEMBLY_ACC=CAM_ASM_000861 /TAXON_ID=933848 /ORGANISM="Elphidium margaritaceum" /LENGTH=225 /DNA_ID=CAMNT_0049360511 /DNA_START=51 /DNA_END=724 /DNA_ORIENTATION=-